MIEVFFYKYTSGVKIRLFLCQIYFMKILVVLLTVSLISFSSCTNINSEGEMLADYCYCKVLSAKDAEEKEAAKRQCNDMKIQVEKQHGKELSKLSKEDQELFYDGFLKKVESCK